MSKARITSWLAAGCLSLGLSAVTAHAENSPADPDPFGQPVVRDRGAVDGGLGQMWIYLTPFHVNEKVVSWSFFDNDTSTGSGDAITPLILQRDGLTGNWTIRGIGTTRTSNNSNAVQSFPFGLVSGSDDVFGTPSSTFGTSGAYSLGWYNGTANGSGVGGSATGGVVNKDNAGNDQWALFDTPGAGNPNTAPSTITVGASHPAVQQFVAFYSIQFQTAIPEPTALGVVGVIGGFATLRRRRKLA